MMITLIIIRIITLTMIAVSCKAPDREREGRAIPAAAKNTCPFSRSSALS